VSRFEEAFTVIRTLIRKGAIDFEGRFYTHRDMELLPRARADMTLLIGSNGPRMLQVAAPHVDLWNSWYTHFDNKPEGLVALLETVDAACAEVGRDPAEIGRTAAVLVQLERGMGRIAGSSERPDVEPIIGSPAGIAESLARFGEVGMSHIQIVLDPIDARSVSELAEAVALLR
jgi:alkanesulfonate monooxygenase SsuD/methylene tetrahydromethanopterin reductase-like flavin-dependent oxidoreductase (luciferase family)